MSRPTVISVCGDPGGAQAIAPVIKVLEAERRVDVVNYAYNEGVDILRRHDIKSTSLPNQIDASWVLQRLQEDKAVLLLTGTSHNGLNREKLFIRSARHLGIRSMAVLDFWSNYAVRFSDEQGNLIYLPDVIAVMDERARREMMADGVPGENILVTGQPAFDALAHYRQQFSVVRKLAIRESLAVRDDDLLVLFASQPMRKLYGSDESDPAYLGFDEASVLHAVINALDAISQKSHRRTTLLIRPHPRETAAEYSHYQSDKINVVVAMQGESRDYVIASDLVIGMNTALLVEACYLGCLVLSLQPGLRKADTLPTNAWGVSLSVCREEEIRPALEEILLNDVLRRTVLSKTTALQLEATATRNVANYIYARTLAQSLTG